MSQREFMIVLAHAHICAMCRDRLLRDPSGVLASRYLTEAEREILVQLKFEDFLTPDTLARATQLAAAELEAFRDEPVVRLRHL